MHTDEIVFIATSYTFSSLAMVINFVWICAIVRYTPLEMRSYKRFLIHSGSNQFVLAFGFMMLMPKPSSSIKEIERPANDSGISYVISGPVVYFIHPAMNHMLTCLFVGHFLYNVLDLPVNDWSEYYSHKGDSNETRFGNLIHMDYKVYYMIYIAAFVLIVGYFLLIFSAIQIFRTLTSLSKTVSKKTYELQRELAISLSLQSAVPIIFIGVPLCIIIVTVSMGFYTPEINSTAMIIFSMHLMLPPLISFVYVRPYREIFTKRLKAKIFKIPVSSLVNQSRFNGPRTVHVTTLITHNNLKRQTL